MSFVLVALYAYRQSGTQQRLFPPFLSIGKVLQSFDLDGSLITLLEPGSKEKQGLDLNQSLGRHSGKEFEVRKNSKFLGTLRVHAN